MMVNDLLSIETIVEVDENERYWVGGGFGRRGLLPNDRGRFTSTDGSIAWKDLDECNEDSVLLGRGWKFEGKEFTHASQWMYAKDFRLESIENAKDDRGMMHFVRFRRLYRTKVFNPDEFIPLVMSEKCNQGDSHATDNVGKLLLDTLAYCSLLHNPATYTDAAAFPLKEQIINIAIHDQHVQDLLQSQSQSSPSKSQSNTNISNNNISDDVFYELRQLRIKLENVIKHESAKTVINRLVSQIGFTFNNRDGHDLFIKRKTIVSRRCFPHKECDAIASLIVKKLDTQYKLHCDQLNCGENCRFFRVQCPNDGCIITLSKIYLDEHDKVCPYKLIQCQCGQWLQRREEEVHKKEACKLREVDCPFKNIGCLSKVRACDLQSHVDEHSSKHLLLSVERLLEHQSVLSVLNAKVIALENENKELKQSLDNHIKKSKKDVSQLDAKFNKTNKNLINHEEKSKKEFLKIFNMLDKE